jgi:4-hydroxybenzoate polyprenyltransferase
MSNAPDMPPAARPSPGDFVRALRINQWTKNGLVLAAMVFGLGDLQQHVALAAAARVVPAMLLFCLASSGIYLINDILDLESDRHHPVKRYRPIAAGRITVGLARAMAVALLAVAGTLSVVLSPRFGAVVLGYAAMQLVYSVALKRVPLVDIMVIAAGFVLRALAGAVVMPGLTLSPWLLLCTFLLALFLAACKRRQEKIGAEDDAPVRQRAALAKYDTQLLDQIIGIVAASTIVCYAIYTLWPETVKKFGTHGLAFTIPFVIFGLFRYLDLVYRHDQGERPEKILLTDGPLMLDLAAYAGAVVLVFLLR